MLKDTELIKLINFMASSGALLSKIGIFLSYFLFLFFFLNCECVAVRNKSNTGVVHCPCIDSYPSTSNFKHHCFCTMDGNVNTVEKEKSVLVLLWKWF